MIFSTIFNVSKRYKNLIFCFLLQEIEEKTPLINQRMLEYEKSKETISCLKSQLANALVVSDLSSITQIMCL